MHYELVRVTARVQYDDNTPVLAGEHGVNFHMPKHRGKKKTNFWPDYDLWN